MTEQSHTSVNELSNGAVQVGDATLDGAQVAAMVEWVLSTPGGVERALKRGAGEGPRPLLLQLEQAWQRGSRGEVAAAFAELSGWARGYQGMERIASPELG